jgi:hypothetical protein
MMDVAAEMCEQPDGFAVGQVDAVDLRFLAAQLRDRVVDHVDDIDVPGAGGVRDILALLERHVGVVKLHVLPVAGDVLLLLFGRIAAAKFPVARLGAIGEHRDLAERALDLVAARVLDRELGLHLLVDLRIALLQHDVGDRADDAMSRIVPGLRRCRERRGGEQRGAEGHSHRWAPQPKVVGAQ